MSLDFSEMQSYSVSTSGWIVHVIQPFPPCVPHDLQTVSYWSMKLLQLHFLSFISRVRHIHIITSVSGETARTVEHIGFFTARQHLFL